MASICFRKVTMPRSKTRAGPGHIKSRYEANRVIFYFSAPAKTAGGLGRVKSMYGANGSFSIIFSPGPKLGQDRGT